MIPPSPEPMDHSEKTDKNIKNQALLREKMTSKDPKVCLNRELDFSFIMIILVILKVDIIKNSFVIHSVLIF